MLKLSNFFQPLNIVNLFYFVIAILFFDVLGSFIKSFFIKDEKIDVETRLVDWILGLGFFVFVWFLLGFYINPNKVNLLVSVCLMFLISFFYYVENKLYLSYIPILKKSILPILLFIPFIPSAFVKASLPPYYADEMAYHFISPYAMLYQLKVFWTFNGGVFMNVPRLMDTLYILGFSLTHTYSVVRLLQFSILATAIMFSFLLIRKNLGSLSAFLFTFILLSLPLELPFMATIGYVDVPAYSFLLIGVLLGLTFLLSSNKEYLLLSLIYWSMSVGTKYTTLLSSVLFVSTLLIIYLIKNKSLKILFNKNIIFKILIAVIVFGGYWYVKNFIVYGNPIYPFIFPCWGNFANTCNTTSSFFGSWTEKINLQTFYPIIIKQLLPQNIVLHILLVVSPVLIMFFGDRKKRLILFLVAIPFFVELFILKYFSGFAIRYQQHLQFYLIFVLILFASTKFKNIYISFFKYLLISILILSTLVFYVRNIKHLNTLGFVNWEEINYSLGKVSIYDWIKKRIPQTVDAVVWCEAPPAGPVALARFDPDMIWYEDAGYMRSYLVNCYYENPSLGTGVDYDFVKDARNQKLKFWTATINPCVPDTAVKPKREGEDSNNSAGQMGTILQMRKLNNTIVCNSKNILPNLYYFDYENLR